MSNLKIDQMVLGMVSTNCYLLSNKETKEVIIIDPADQANRIIEKCKELGVKPVAILLTHGHFDHMTASGALKEF
ncbi:MAG: MBL fold metallo-hydrolase [Lachnospiraceae bacterium]